VKRSERANFAALCFVVTFAALSFTGIFLAAPARAQTQSQSAPRAQSPAPAQSPGVAAPRIHLQPKLFPGQVLRYQIQFQTSSQTRRSGAIADPQGPLQTLVTWNAVLRVEVLPAAAAAAPSSAAQPPTAARAPAPGTIRLRTTYEKSSATLQSDTPDPEQQSLEAQYARMEGKSMEFTLTPDGHVSDVQGLEGIVSGADAIAAAQQWMQQFSSGASEPAAGVVPGDSWNSQDAASSLPLAGYVWRSDSSYVRNEPCPSPDPVASSTPSSASSSAPPSAAPAPAPAPASNPQTCAVILSQLNLLAPRASKDPTPPQYSAEGLKTAGTWGGSGQSETYISVQTGWVVSVTQNMSEKMDVTITPRGQGIRYAGAVTTRSAMSLIPLTAP
jgi:hypothetical protein